MLFTWGLFTTDGGKGKRKIDTDYTDGHGGGAAAPPYPGPLPIATQCGEGGGMGLMGIMGRMRSATACCRRGINSVVSRVKRRVRHAAEHKKCPAQSVAAPGEER